MPPEQGQQEWIALVAERRGDNIHTHIHTWATNMRRNTLEVPADNPLGREEDRDLM
jgi:hypothetical protein